MHNHVIYCKDRRASHSNELLFGMPCWKGGYFPALMGSQVNSQMLVGFWLAGGVHNRSFTGSFTDKRDDSSFVHTFRALTPSTFIFSEELFKICIFMVTCQLKIRTFWCRKVSIRRFRGLWWVPLKVWLLLCLETSATYQVRNTSVRTPNLSI